MLQIVFGKVVLVASPAVDRTFGEWLRVNIKFAQAVDTEKEMLKSPFDRNTAIGQVEKNCIRYPKLALGAIMPIAIRGCSLEQMTNDDILKILQLQFGILMAEDGV